VTTQHHPDDRTALPPRPARCLRHHVWMAACPACRDARVDTAAPAARPAAVGAQERMSA
jgi:hypothetical protein